MTYRLAPCKAACSLFREIHTAERKPTEALSPPAGRPASGNGPLVLINDSEVTDFKSTLKSWNLQSFTFFSCVVAESLWLMDMCWWGHTKHTHTHSFQGFIFAVATFVSYLLILFNPALVLIFQHRWRKSSCLKCLTRSLIQAPGIIRAFYNEKSIFFQDNCWFLLEPACAIDWTLTPVWINKIEGL